MIQASLASAGVSYVWDKLHKPHLRAFKAPVPRDCSFYPGTGLIRPLFYERYLSSVPQRATRINPVEQLRFLQISQKWMGLQHAFRAGNGMGAAGINFNGHAERSRKGLKGGFNDVMGVDAI